MRNSPILAFKIAILAALLFVPGSLATASSASAQGFFESIFGVFTPKKPRPMRQMRRRPALVQQPSQVYGERRRANPFSEQPAYYTPRPRRGRYRTLCVRLCDGYYFPISNSTRRRQFYEAAEQCQARCNSETRLFYTSPSSSSIDAARDIEGRSYKKLRNAFVYRKKLIKGCSCRPKPWSVAERVRHTGYATTNPGGLKVANVNTSPGDANGHAGQPATEIAADEASAVAPQIAPRPGAQPESPPVVRYTPKPALRSARKLVERRRYARRKTLQQKRRAKPVKKNFWGLGAAGLPPVKYRHRWPGDPS